MGKYFSKDSELSKYVLPENTESVKNVIPLTDNLTNTLSDTTKEKLSKRFEPTNQDEYIDMVREQTDHVSNMIKKYSDESKKEFKNQFDKFAPAELFEKLNQLIFVVADLSNRITSLENKFSNNNTPPNSKNEIEISDPADLFRLQHELDTLDSSKRFNQKPQNIPDVSAIREHLSNIKQGNKVRTIPTEEYIDKGIKLEEVFPNLDDEAYQAVYSSLSKQKTHDYTTDDKPTPGGMRGITGF